MSILRVVLLTCGLFLSIPVHAADERSFCIEVVDEQSGRGVPLVELRTVNNIRYYTDSAGIVAFDEPGLMNQSVFFHVSGHGYEYAKDAFGFRGARLKITPGGSAKLKIRRLNIAERLYRLTGGGIYRDSVLTSRPVPDIPVLNGQVFGSDSVVNAVYRGKVYWFWGDTNRPSYPLGNFHVPGAVSELPSRGGLDPEIGVKLDYFVGDDGFARPTAKMPGEGPTWIGGLTTIRDSQGRERLFASYVKVKPPLTIYARGLAEFDDRTRQFEQVASFDMQSALFPTGHPFKYQDQGVQYVAFGNPFPVIRVRATPEHLRDLSKYEAYTCLTQGSRADKLKVDRKDGRLRFAWKTDTVPFTPKLQQQLVNDRQITRQESLYRLSAEGEKPILIHSGSVRWNNYRKRWIMIGLELFGTSALGEVWYAEAEQMVGPWMDARKIVSHDRYSFYNPKQHEMFDKKGGRVIFFEGTYTNMFSGNSDQTPRYNYNQIMYKLDLADPRLR